MIFTLCGSARFEKEFKEWNWRLTKLGHPAFSLTVYPSDRGGEKNWYTPEEKTTLDLIHLAKIKASDAVLILNVGGYVGESTAREVEWARILEKRVVWLEETPRRREFEETWHLFTLCQRPQPSNE